MFDPDISETEFNFSQGEYLGPGTSADVSKGVCYALSYMWIRLGLKPGGHLKMHLQVSLQKKFKNTGDGNRVARSSAGSFLRDIGGNPTGFGQEVYSMQRAIKAQQDITGGGGRQFTSGLKTVAARDGFTENLVANGPELNKMEPFSTFIKWLRENRARLNQGYCLIGYTGAKSGHAIAVQLLPGDQWRVFDPNFGSFIFNGYARFKSMFNELGLLYLAEGVAGGAWNMSTFR